MDNPKSPEDFISWLGLRKIPDWTVARALGPAVAILLFLFIVLALVAAAITLFNSIHVVENNGLGTGTLIVAVLGAPILIWRTWIAQRTLGFQKEGHITDRISRAVEQLGSEKTIKRSVIVAHERKTVEETFPNIEVRVGGILSLERIAQDSTIYDNGRDHLRIMEILCTYIRHNAPNNFSTLLDVLDTSEERNVKPREDIQLALWVIGRRNSNQLQVEATSNSSKNELESLAQFYNLAMIKKAIQEMAELDLEPSRIKISDLGNLIQSKKHFVLNLSGTDLRGADLKYMNFSNANFQESRLSNANFQSSVLTGANFNFVGASEVKFCGSSLSFSNFENSKLEMADFNGATLDGISFRNSEFKNCYFENIECYFANFQSTNHVGTSFGVATLVGTDFRNAKLANVFFDEASLIGLNILDSEMSIRTMEQAQIKNTNFQKNVKISKHRPDRFDVLDDIVSLGALKYIDTNTLNELFSTTVGDTSVKLPTSVSQRPPSWFEKAVSWENLGLVDLN